MDNGVIGIEVVRGFINTAVKCACCLNLPVGPAHMSPVWAQSRFTPIYKGTEK